MNVRIAPNFLKKSTTIKLMKWRTTTLLLFIFAPFLILWGVIYTFYSTDSKIKAAYVAWSSGNIKEAESKLDTLSAEYPLEFNLYKAYLQRSNLEMDLAYLSLEKALISSEKAHSSSELKEEMILNRILHDMAAQNDNRLKATLTLYSSELKSQGAYDFCQGLKSYLNQDYLTAYNAFQDLNFTPNGSGKHSQWLERAWKESFSSLWKEVVLADCECNLNKYTAVKQRLEPLTVVNTYQHHEKIYRILAVNALNESCDLTAESRKEAINASRFYLSQIRNSYKHEGVKKALFTALEKELEKPDEESLQFLLTALHEWKADSLLNNCAESLVKSLDFNHERKPFLLWLRQRFPQNIFTKLIEEQLTLRLAESLHFDSLQHFRDLYDFVLKYHSDPHRIVETTSSQLKELAFEAMFKEDPTLPHTLVYLSHWVNLDPSQEKKQTLSADIIKAAERLWLRDGQESKATTLMEVALYISEEPSYGPLHRRIEGFLTSLYQKSQRCNTLKRLSSIYDAFDRLRLLSDDLINSINLENHLADAEYLFKIHRFEDAQAHAEWILKWQPHNQAALRLYGLTCYYQGEYFKAFHALTCLVQPDEQAQDVLQLSQLMQTQEEGSIITIDP